MRLDGRPTRKALAAIVAAGAAATVGSLCWPASVSADLDSQLFTSSEHRIKITVPKGWRASEQPSYPGIVLWMLRSQPEARIVVGTEELRQELVCAWPAECRGLSKPLAERYACALRAQLERQDILVGQVQAGPKENVAAGMPSVWFEFTDGKRYVRQAIAANERRVVSFALSTGSIADRGTHARAFDQALRSLQELSEAEVRAAAPATASAENGTGSGPLPPPPSSTGPAPSSSTAAPSPAAAAPAPLPNNSAVTPADRTKIQAPLFNPSERCPDDPAPTAAHPPVTPKPAASARATPAPSTTSSTGSPSPKAAP